MNTNTNSADPHTYYIHRAPHGFELRQTRFEANFKRGVYHPHDVCAVWMTDEQWESMRHHFAGGIRPICLSTVG